MRFHGELPLTNRVIEFPYKKKCSGSVCKHRNEHLFSDPYWIRTDTMLTQGFVICAFYLTRFYSVCNRRQSFSQ